jgi:ATP-dependent Clp protease ATP-binding subunit ClpA
LFWPGRQFPDKAIDLMDEACTAVKLRKQKQVENIQGSTISEPKEVLTVGPGHVAQVN